MSSIDKALDEKTPRKALSINEYCAQEPVSRSRLYAEWRAGRGPRYFNRGRRRYITPEAADEYRAQMEAETLALGEAAS